MKAPSTLSFDSIIPRLIFLKMIIRDIFTDIDPGKMFLWWNQWRRTSANISERNQLSNFKHYYSICPDRMERYEISNSSTCLKSAVVNHTIQKEVHKLAIVVISHIRIFHGQSRKHLTWGMINNLFALYALAYKLWYLYYNSYCLWQGLK